MPVDHLPFASRAAQDEGAPCRALLRPEMERNHGGVRTRQLHVQVPRIQSLGDRRAGVGKLLPLAAEEALEHLLDSLPAVDACLRLCEWKEHGHVIRKETAEPIPLELVEGTQKRLRRVFRRPVRNARGGRHGGRRLRRRRCGDAPDKGDGDESSTDGAREPSHLKDLAPTLPLFEKLRQLRADSTSGARLLSARCPESKRPAVGRALNGWVGLPTVAASEASAWRRRMAEREGFEPPCRLPDKTLSRRPRYDHFGTSPFITSLGGAPLHSPPRCALAIAFGDCPPALACGLARSATPRLASALCELVFGRRRSPASTLCTRLPARRRWLPSDDSAPAARAPASSIRLRPPSARACRRRPARCARGPWRQRTSGTARWSRRLSR